MRDLIPAEAAQRAGGCVSNEALADVARRVNQGMTLRVFLMLPMKLDFIVFRKLRMAGLAQELGTSVGSISRAMAELNALGVVERLGKGPVLTWRLAEAVSAKTLTARELGLRGRSISIIVAPAQPVGNPSRAVDKRSVPPFA